MMNVFVFVYLFGYFFYPVVCDVSGCVELDAAPIETDDVKHQSHFVNGPFCQSAKDNIKHH